ncbi:MAG: T9SS type A sorting domain-containing protein [Bacteroidetes bacterium]|nr:T9SS type A sorting domain-containing protein [Bacteroidota bacterium]
MRKVIGIFCLALSNLTFAQTGPGGVGTSTGTSSLKMWYRTDAGVVSTSGNVDSIRNSAGISGLSLGETGAQRPTLVASAVNGFSEISFSGSNRLRTGLNLTTTNFVNTEASTFVVCRADNTTQTSCVYTTDALVGTTRFTCHIPWSGTVYFDIGTCCTNDARMDVGGLANLTSYSFWSYDANATSGKQLYRNGTLLLSRANTSTYNSHASQYFNLGGNTSGTNGFVGDLTEMILFNTKVNSAQRIIIENYLAAKYGLTSAANDHYLMDDVGNGNFDYEVAGIGRVDASNIHNDAQGTGIVKINSPNNLGDNEFLIWGHDNVSVNANNTTDVPTGVQARMSRTWRASEVGEVGTIDVSVDLAGLGSVTASDLALLIDKDNDGLLSDETPDFTATLVSGTVYRWSGVDIDNGQRFSFGTANSTQTPLPIELTEFYAQPESSTIVLNWITATEINNNRFEIERSKDGIVFEKIGNESSKAQGGNSTSNLVYSFIDLNPYSGTSYYRLKQIDHDGKFEYHSIISVDREESKNIKFVVFPNPNQGEFSVDFSGIENEHEVMIEMYSMDGKLVYSNQFISSSSATNTVQIIPQEKIVAGQYFVNFIVEGVKYPVKVIVN